MAEFFNGNKISTGNTFHQSISNVGKLGFYPTDPQHCRKIAEMLNWPEGEVNALEPSVGNGIALRTVLAGADKQKIHTYGVELNADIFAELKEHREEMKLDYILNADFLRGIKISNNRFSFCFSNPPYGDSDNCRLEQEFVEKIFGYMKPRGLLVLVIPYYDLADEKFVKSFYGRFDPLGVYRFDDAEYSKYKQIVIFANRRSCTGFLRDNLTNWLADYREIERIPYLSQTEDTYDVPASPEEISFFTTKVFDADNFREALFDTALSGAVYKQCIKPYSAIEAGNPPIPLTSETSHLVAVCGVGSGFAGNEETGNLHLQRGVVEVQETEKYVDDGDKGGHIEVVKSSVTTMNILDSDFNYIKLEGEKSVSNEDDAENEDDEE